MPDKTLPRGVTGKDGTRFIFKEHGKRLALSDYAPVSVSIFPRGSGRDKTGKSWYDAKRLKEEREKIVEDAISDLKSGKFISSIIFVALCDQFGVKMSIYTRLQCKYMHELDVSVRMIRHKNTRGIFTRSDFEMLFQTIELLMVEII